jgi:two-component system, cell cycle sensor histidine kinase and response regulator CckA
MSVRDERWAARLESADLRQLTQHAPDMLMVVDLEHRIQFINWTVAGLDVEQVLGTEFLAYVSPDQHATVRASFDHVRRTREPSSYRSVYVSPESSAPREWESRIGPVIEEGAVIGFAVFARDVTERNAQARELTRFFELSVDMLCVLDDARCFRRVSSSFSTTLGYAMEELRGQSLVELIHKSDREATLGHLLCVAEGRQDVHFETRFKHKSGSFLLLSWRARHDAETRVIFAVARDITQERNLEFQLRESQKMDAVGQLAGGLAHDFNNLMLAVLANAEFAREELNEDTPLGEYLAQISDAASRATVLTKQLLAFSRREAIRRVAIDANELTRTLMQLLRRLIPANVEIDFIPGAHVPKLDCDPNQLEQVLINLCINARDAMPHGGRITIETDAAVLDDRFRESHPWAKPGRYGLLTITDSGIGMVKDVCDRIFEPFFTTKGPGKGTGLGLATVYAIVKQHGGLVHVQSEPGHGSSFKLYIPVAAERASDSAGQRDSGLARGEETILVAEDEPLVRQVVTQILERAGYRVMGARNGKEAIDLLKDNLLEVRLVLLDVMMPEMSGPEAYYQIRQLLPELPVLFSSGYSNDARFGHSVPRDCVLIEKPYRSEELLRAVRLALTARLPE